jgi:hypothetical protein
MAGGELSAVFKGLAQDAAKAGENIGSSIARFTEKTADIEEENVSRTLAADAENARALENIRPDPGNLPEGGAGGAAGAGGGGNRIAQLLNGKGGASLTAEDVAALHDYTTNDGYTTMNPFLRNSGGYSDAEQAAIQARADRVSTGLAKLPPRPGMTYRGVNLPDDIVRNYQPGSVVTERAFTSTSTNPGVATGAFDGNTLMVVTGHSGRDIAPFSEFPESEILYDKGTQFLVTGNSFDPTTGKIVIRMREVN